MLDLTLRKIMDHQIETPLIKISENIFLKLEFLHPGRSHKARAVEGILNEAEINGKLVRNGGYTIIEKTGGNLGVALAIEGLRRGYNVDLVVALSYSLKKRKLLSQLGAKLIGSSELSKGATPKQIIENRMNENRFGNKKYVHLDQFIEPGSYKGHYDTLAPEISSQLDRYNFSKDRRIHLIKGAGTGASAAAIYKYLADHGYDVSLHLVQPQGCDYSTSSYIDHAIQGIAVGSTPRFIDFSKVSSYINIKNADAKEGQLILLRNLGLFCGISSGANYKALLKLRANVPPSDILLTVLYDRGEDY